MRIIVVDVCVFETRRVFGNPMPPNVDDRRSIRAKDMRDSDAVASGPREMCNCGSRVRGDRVPNTVLVTRNDM